MLQLKEVLDVLRKHKKVLEDNYAVCRIGIFGSFTKNKQTKKSDLDIYVEFRIEDLSFDKYLGLIEYLERLFNRKIDIITKAGVESIRIPYIKEKIKRSIVFA